VNFVAMSFVHSAKDLTPLREMISHSSRPLLLIAKVEKPQAVTATEKNLEVIDEIIEARDNLGIEMPIE